VNLTAASTDGLALWIIRQLLLNAKYVLRKDNDQSHTTHSAITISLSDLSVS